MRVGPLLLTVCLAPAIVAGRTADTFDTRTASFAINFHDETSAYRDTALVAMPGAAVVLSFVQMPAEVAFTTSGVRI